LSRSYVVDQLPADDPCALCGVLGIRNDAVRAQRLKLVQALRRRRWRGRWRRRLPGSVVPPVLNRGAWAFAEVEQPQPQQQHKQRDDASDRQAELEDPAAGYADLAQHDEAKNERYSEQSDDRPQYHFGPVVH
jgi:hypothetical protein